MCSSKCWWKWDSRTVEFVRGYVFNSAHRRWCLGLMSLDRCHYKQLSEMQSVGVWQHILSVFKSHRGTIQQATPRAVSWLFLLLFHIPHSLTWCIYCLQRIMERPLYLTFLNIFTLLLFGPQSKISVVNFLHLKLYISVLLDPQINCPHTESFNALDCFLPVAWHMVSWSYFFIVMENL